MDNIVVHDFVSGFKGQNQTTGHLQEQCPLQQAMEDCSYDGSKDSLHCQELHTIKYGYRIYFSKPLTMTAVTM